MITDSMRQGAYILIAVAMGIMVMLSEHITFNHYFLVIIGVPIIFKLEEVNLKLADIHRRLNELQRLYRWENDARTGRDNKKNL